MRADGNETRSYLKQCGSDCPPSAAVATISDTFNGSARTRVPVIAYSDNAGHLLRTKSWGPDGRATLVDHRFDLRGRLWETDHPRFEGDPAYLGEWKTYDDPDRVTAVTSFDESGVQRSTTSEYHGLVTVLTNPRGYRRTETRTAIGQVQQVLDANLKLTKFEYEPFGNLSKTTDPNGNVITVTYDLLGRKTDLRDPNLGWIHYGVDPLGLTYAQVSPKRRALGQKTRMEYDELGRMTARYEPDLESHWVFDTAANGKGQLAEAYTITLSSVKDYRREHAYDIKGRPTVTALTLFGGLYTTTLGYDDWGRPVTTATTRPNGGEKVFGTRYDITGGVSRVERGNLVLWRAIRQDAAGRPLEAALGNNLTQTRVFDPYTGRQVNGSLSNTMGEMRLTEGYQYDEIGSVK